MIAGGFGVFRAGYCRRLALVSIMGLAALSWPGHADTMTDLDHVSLVRQGAPYQSGRWEADVAAFPVDQRSELERLVEDAQRHPAPAPSSPPPPDALAYVITLRSKGGTQVLSARDDTITPEFQRLEAWLRTHLPRTALR
jgi:hypothetical protein